MAAKAKRIVYRIPRYVLGPKVFMAYEVADKLPWSLRTRNMDQIWAETQGEGVTVAILDTGLWKHKDLPDPVFARNFSHSGNVFDSQGHGTHVAGTVAARIDGAGVVGWAPKCNLGCVKVLGDDGSGDDEGIANGIYYAAESGADIISMSLGGGYSKLIAKACLDVIQRGVFMIVAAGNDGVQGDQNTMGWPARLPQTIAIASYREDGRISEFSSRGPEVDMAFPGEDILSTWLNGTFRSISGTCIAEGSYVYTPQGPKTIEQIRAGDPVYAYKDGKLVQRIVHGVYDRGTAETQRLVAAGRDVHATASHEMLCVNTKARDLEWVRLGQLTDDHRLLLPRKFESQINPYLDSIMSEDLCWLLGFFAGDGWISMTTRGLRTCFAKGDKPEVAQRVAALYEQFCGKRMSQDKSGSWLYDDSTVVAMMVEVLGMNNPAQSKNFPLWLWNLPRHKRMAFYRGYNRADTHTLELNEAFPNRNLGREFECTSPDLVRRAAIFADYEGWKHGAVRSRTRLSRAPSQHEAAWATSHCLSLTEAPPDDGITALYPSGKRYAHRAMEYFRGMGLDPAEFFLAGWRVAEKEAKTVRVYDLNVPDADCFVTQGLVTHNSMATPAASGLAALTLAAYRKNAAALRPTAPVRNNDEMLTLWKKYATDAGKPGFDTSFGWGMVDIDGVVRAALPSPGQPPTVPNPPGPEPGVPPAPPPDPDAPPVNPGNPGGVAFGGLGINFIKYNGVEGLFLYVKP